MFCTSQASTAICMSMDQPSSSSSSASQLGGRAIDRHNPIIRDSRRFTINPCTSQPPPINPTPYHLLVTTKKISSSSSSDQITKKKKKKKRTDLPSNAPEKRKSSAVQEKDKNVVVSGRKSWAADCRPQFITDRLITPPGSSRYLLSEVGLFDEIVVDQGQALELVPSVEDKSKQNNSGPLKGATDLSSSDINLSSSSQHEKVKADQVVVLRVSLHCKGCEGKVRKHLSRMEGVTSYSIDFKEKKVTITGDVTPLGVLASVSKVKSAQLWTAATVPSPYATPSHAPTPTKFSNI